MLNTSRLDGVLEEVSTDENVEAQGRCQLWQVRAQNAVLGTGQAGDFIRNSMMAVECVVVCVMDV